jgi:hypothetical protein
MDRKHYARCTIESLERDGIVILDHNEDAEANIRMHRLLFDTERECYAALKAVVAIATRSCVLTAHCVLPELEDDDWVVWIGVG